MLPSGTRQNRACPSRGSLPALAFLVLVSLVGCTGNRFQLANRDDTPYERRLAETDVRVPVEPGASAPLVPAFPSPSTVQTMPVAPSAAAPLAATYPPTAAGAAVPLQAVEIAGRVVGPTGQPAPRVAVQAIDPRQPDQIAAEVVTDDLGTFRMRNLAGGSNYRLVAAGQNAEGRLSGSVTTVPPDGGVVIQLQPDSLLSGRSPLGNRLGSTAAVDLPRLGEPVALASASGAAIGSVTVSTLQPIPSPPVASAELATLSQGRVLPPQARQASNPSITATATPTATTDIKWDDPAGSKATTPAKEADFAAGKETDLALPDTDLKLPSDRDLQLDDFSADAPKSAPKSSAPAAAAPTLAFAGTGLEYAKVYDLEGNKRPIGALAGEVILLDFFGSWCGPCRRAIPHLNDIYARYGDRVHLVGVACEYGNTTLALRAANSAVDEFSIRYPVIVSPMDEPSELRDHFGISAFPTLVLVDRTGKVLFKGEGGDTSTLSKLEAAIEQVLAGSRVAAR